MIYMSNIRFAGVLTVFIILLSVAPQTSVAEGLSRRQLDSLMYANGIPVTAVVADECYDGLLIMNVDGYDSENELDIVTLWLWESKSRKARKLLTTHFGDFSHIIASEAKEVPKAAVYTIHTAKFVGDGKILVEGVPDARNVYTYIMDITTGKTLLLPTNAGFLGFTSEEGLMVCQSYAYYEGGGRYTVLKVIDYDGRAVRTFSLKDAGR